jgi:hypothetical protein
MDHKDLREVSIYFKGRDHTITYIVPKEDVYTFLKAAVELYYSPGINPHNGVKTTEAWRITVSELGDFDSFWWTVPGLKRNHDPKGARVADWWFENELWVHPELAAQRKEEEDEEESNI